MTRTFGPDNAIAWVQVRLRGGPRNLLTTTLTYAAVVGLAMVGSVQLVPARPGDTLAGWVGGLLGLQVATLLLSARRRIASAIRLDINTGIIESNRLMPVAAPQAVLGYILGAASQALCVAVANVLLGLVAAVGSGAAPDRFLIANAVLLSFSGFVWVTIACAAMHPRNVIGLLFLVPLAIVLGQGGVLGLLPGFTLLLTPLLGTTIFDRSAGLHTMTDAFLLSGAAQVVVGTLFFAAAARKYRRADVIGFTPLLGLLLLAAWVGASWVGIEWWDAMRPRMFYFRWDEANGQALASVITAMIVALVPVWAATEQYVEWTRHKMLGDPALGRRPVPNWVVIVAATLLILPLPLVAGPTGIGMSGGLALPALGVVAAVVPLHLATTSYFRRTLRFHTTQGNGLLVMLLGFVWVGPLLADLIRHEMFDKFNDPVMTEISCLSPVGALMTAFDGRTAQTPPGLIVQACVALLAAALYHWAHPERPAASCGAGAARYIGVMIELTPDESRVLGVLIEKATTTPEQYPLSLNAVVSGANQKNNRDPVLTMTDDAAFDALESMRAKGLVVRIEAGAGSRVHRFRHNAGDALRVRAGELAILAELLLRGPQTQGELRGRASRMHPMESLDVTRDMLRALRERPEPLVREIAPSPGSRAERYMQLLCVDLHEVETPPESGGAQGEPAPRAAAPGGGLADRVTKLEAEVAQLREALRRLATSVGEADPTVSVEQSSPGAAGDVGGAEVA